MYNCKKCNNSGYRSTSHVCGCIYGEAKLIILRQEIQDNFFGICGDQLETLSRWKEEHSCKFRKGTTGTIGEQYTYSFTPTSLGIITVVTCACGDKIDLTDYEAW